MHFIHSKKSKPVFATLLLSSTIGFATSNLSAEVITPNVAAAIQEPAGVYNNNPADLINMHVTTLVGSGPCVTGDYTGCTFDDVLNDIVRDEFKPEVKVHMTADNYPDDGRTFNARIRQRGKASRLGPQKSFRVKLEKGLPLWSGERRIQLLKSPWESTRILHKLSYDLFKPIPNLPSIRTQFIHLDITDQGTTSDYGLYTQAEYVGKEYLQRRGWDKNSRLYKPKYFWFQNEAAFAMGADDKPVDPVAFDGIIEIKRGKTHREFANMVKAVNNQSLDFQSQVFNKHFDKNNFLSFFAVNILTNNEDTIAKNYYLYNPKNSEKFYFLPWDYDYAWGANYNTFSHLPRWWFSVSNWWGVKLHRRFLQQPGNLDLLKQAVLEIKNKYMTPGKIAALRDSYYDVVFPVIRNSPDWNYIELGNGTDPERVAKFNQLFADLSQNVNFNYARFLEGINDPMPFYMQDPEFRANHDIRFRWNNSVSLTGQTVVYDLDVSTSKLFTPGTLVEHIQNIPSNRYTLHWRHPKGTYYFRIVARDAANPQQHWQISFDAVLNYANGDELFGVKQMVVAQDGDTTNPPPPPPPPTSGSVSNPVTGIAVNGNASDWNGLTAFPTDPDDIGGGSTNVIDWQSASMAHNGQKLYLLYRNRGPVDPNRNSGSYTSWGWQVFLDTDNNPATGFKLNGSFGADYLLEATELQRYTGTGNNWNWQVTGQAASQFKGNINELSLNRSELGNPQSMRIVFQGSNEAYGGSSKDRYPDSGYLSYSFGGGTTPPTNHAPVAANQSQSVVVNTRTTISLNATDADTDTLSMSIVQQPAHGTLVGTGLTVQYTPNQNYTGADSFRYRVNDGTVNSNIATVSINVINSNPGTGISNPVVNGGITVNGSRSDWNGLHLFATDPDDIGSGDTIDWLRAGMAHSSSTVYLMYENRGRVDQSKASGSFLPWGWQTFIDTDSNASTGYQLDNGFGADYLIEGQHVFRYNGSGWNWTDMGTATSRFNGSVAELSFPRSWLGSHASVKVAFLGNNEAFGGNSIDAYPNNGSFEYYFGNGTQGRVTPVASGQSGVLSSPQNHQPDLSTNTTNVGNNGTPSSGGGSFYWMLLLPSFLLGRRRYLALRDH